MAISQTKYINIVSAVGGEAAVSQRELMGRVFTSNILVPVNQVIEFTGGAINALKSIGDYFGITSAEYEFAAQYFQVSKTGTMPQKISFARYTNEATGATVIGTTNASTLTQIRSITSGELGVTVNGETTQFDGINLANVDSLAAVAEALTEKVNALGTFTYNAELARFIFTTTETGTGVTVGFMTGNVAQALGMTIGTGVISDGSAGMTPLQAVSDSAALSNNFFSFTFLEELGIEDITALAQWTHNQNVRYLYSITVTIANAATIANAVASFDGVALTLDKFNNNACFMPMSRIAAIDYTQPNSALNMNYQQFAGVEASILSDTEAATYDAILVNYYGATQQAGRQVAWYQPGILQGSITDMGVYANEAWMKDSIFTNLLNLRLGLNTLPANNVGKGLVLSIIMDTVNAALYNGSILSGKTLDANQKAFITQISGDKDAWMNVQTSGFYLTADVEKYEENGITKYKVSYLLIYSKGDSINYVDGRDILI